MDRFYIYIEISKCEEKGRKNWEERRRRRRGWLFSRRVDRDRVVVCMAAAAAASPAVAIINQEGSQPSVGWSATSNACEEFGARKRIYLRIRESCLLRVGPPPTRDRSAPPALLFPKCREGKGKGKGRGGGGLPIFRSSRGFLSFFPFAPRYFVARGSR